MKSLLEQASLLDQKVGQFLNIENQAQILARFEESLAEIQGTVKRGIHTNKIAASLKIDSSSLIDVEIDSRVEVINHLLKTWDAEKLLPELKSLSKSVNSEIDRLQRLITMHWDRLRNEARPIIGTLQAFASIGFRDAGVLSQKLNTKASGQVPAEAVSIEDLFRELSEANRWIRDQTGGSAAINLFIEECIKDGSTFEMLMEPEVAQWLREKGLLGRIRVKLA